MFCPFCGKELPEESGFCLQCGKPLVAQTEKKKTGLSAFQVVGICLLVLVLIVYVAQRLNTPTQSFFKPYAPAQAQAPVLVPTSTKLFSGQLIVKAGGHVFNKFTVEPGMQNFHVVCHFNASGGSGNDIQAVLVEEDEFQNWINGHQAKAFYSSGKVTTGKCDVGPLAAGRYVFAFSNTFSAFSDKQVFAEVEASWFIRR